MDVIAINQAGFSNVVATLGTAITADQARLISRYASEVIIAYDSDGAGQKATKKAIAHFNDVGLSARILHIENAKDPDEYIKKFGSDRFRLLLEKSGDAIAFQMEQCKSGLDLSSDADKGKWLNRLIDILANIPNVLTRDVYISKAASETNISPDILRNQIEIYNKKEKSKLDKNNWDKIKQQTAPLSMRTPEGESIQHLERSEETLIGYLLIHPEEIITVSKAIEKAERKTEFFDKIINEMLSLEQNNKEASFSALGANLSVDEMARLSKILEKQRNIPPNEQVAKDCIKTICTTSSLSFDNNDDLLRLVEQKKKKR